MRNFLRNRIILSGFTSFVLAYTLYVYVLQTTAFFSRSRLVFALAMGVVLFFVLQSGVKVLRLSLRFSQNAGWGIGSLIILIHLIVAGWFFKLPYTYVFLPIQTIRIQPLDEAPVRLVSLNTEFVAWVGLENFLVNEGWRAGQGGIILEEGKQNELVWQGRPGQWGELRFQTCPQCGKVQVQWHDTAYENVDLAESMGGNSLTIRYQYPSLSAHRVVNLLALELSILLLAVWGWAIGHSIFEQLPYKGERETGQDFPLKKHLPFVGLAAFTWVVYGLKIQPILFNDDWCFIYKLTFDIIEPSIIRRPLLPIFIRLLMAWIPPLTMVYAVYYIQVGLLFATSVLIYGLINRLFEKREWFAFLAAALFLVFPADYTRLNFTMAGIRLGYLLMVAGMIWMADFLKSGKLSLLLTVMVSLAASLLMYEGQLGLIAAFPGALLFLSWGHLNRQRIIGFVGYYTAVTLFLLWKLLIQPHLFTDPKFDSLAFSPGEIIARYLYAPVLIFNSYTFPFRDGNWLTLENLWIGLLIVIGTGGLGAIAWVLFKSWKRAHPLENALKTKGRIILVGFGFWAAGYLPLILNYPPNLYGHLSRVNMFSILGTVLLLLALFHAICLSLSRSEGLAARLTVGFGLMLILGGSLIQIQIQEANNRAWEETRAFYQALFHEVPDVKNGTQMILTLKGYETHRELYRPLLSSSWEAWCAFGLLYGKTDLHVNYQYEQMTTPDLATPGVLTSVLEKEYRTPIQDPGKLLIIEYDNQTRNLVIRKDGSGFLPDGVLASYSPYDQIVPLEAPLEVREIVR